MKISSLLAMLLCGSILNAQQTPAPTNPAPAAPAPAVGAPPVVETPAAPEAEKITGIIKSTRVNARGKPSAFSEQIFQFDKGEQVIVLEELIVDKPKAGDSKVWFRVPIPIDVPVWVNSKFVDLKTKVVTANELNVRSGPGENFPVLGRLPRGAAILTIEPAKKSQDWVQIHAMQGLSAFVAAEFVTISAVSNVVEIPIAKTTTPTPVPTPIPNPTPIPPVETVVTVPFPFTAVKPAATNVVEAFPAPPAVKVNPPAVTKTEIPVVPVPTPPNETIAKTVKPEIAPTAAAPKANLPWWKDIFYTKPAVAAAPKTTTPITVPVTPPVAEKLPVRIVTREGIVQRTLNIQSPAPYVLEHIESGKVINYLISTNADLPMKLLTGRRVLVTGEEAIDSRWADTPVLKIQTLKTTDN